MDAIDSAVDAYRRVGFEASHKNDDGDLVMHLPISMRAKSVNRHQYNERLENADRIEKSTQYPNS